MFYIQLHYAQIIPLLICLVHLNMLFSRLLEVYMIDCMIQNVFCYSNTHTHTCISIRSYINTFIDTCMNSYMHIGLHACLYAYIRIYIPACMDMYLHTCIDIYILSACIWLTRSWTWIRALKHTLRCFRSIITPVQLNTRTGSETLLVSQMVQYLIN